MSNVVRPIFTADKYPSDLEANQFLDAIEHVIEACNLQTSKASKPWVKENLDDVLDALIDIKCDVQQMMQETSDGQ